MSVRDVEFLNTVETKYKRYAREDLGFRHVAEFRDGLTPVQRRSLWTLHHELGASSRTKMIASARVTGDCMGRYHPHEPNSIYGAIVGLSQAKTNVPPILGVGNFGSLDDPPAAPRYTYCYLSGYGNTFFDQHELAQVPFDPSYDGKHQEPRYLPAKVPHLLLSGNWGISPGVSCNIPPCSPAWVMDALDATLRGREIPLPKLFNYRWGGRLVRLEKNFVREAHSSASFAPTVVIDRQRRAVILTSMAPGFSIQTLETYLEKKSASYGGIAQESPLPGEVVRFVIQTKRGASVDALHNDVRSKLLTKVTFSFLTVSYRSAGNDVDFVPKFVSPRELLVHWLVWRRRIVVGAAKTRIQILQAEIDRSNLMLRVMPKRKELLNALDSAKSDAALIASFMRILRCSDEDAKYVLSVNLRKLANLEVAPLRKRIAESEIAKRANEVIVSKPDKRLMNDANTTSLALTSSLAEAHKFGDIGGRRARDR